MADLDNPETGPLVEKYLQGSPEKSGEYRARRPCRPRRRQARTRSRAPRGSVAFSRVGGTVDAEPGA